MLLMFVDCYGIVVVCAHIVLSISNKTTTRKWFDVENKVLYKKVPWNEPSLFACSHKEILHIRLT